MSNLELFVPLMFLAVIAVEGFTEFIFGTLFEKIPALSPYDWTLKYISLAVGLSLAFYYDLDVATVALLPHTPVGVVITGLALGRGGNFVNNIFSLIASWTKK